MASNTSNSREKEFLIRINKLNAELHQSSRIDDHGTIKIAMAKPGLKSFNRRDAAAKQLVEDEHNPQPQLFPQLDQDRWADEMNQIVERELNPDKPGLFPQLVENEADHGTIKIAMAKPGLKRFNRRKAAAKKMVENEHNPQRQLFPQLDQDRWAEEVNQMVERGLNPDKPELFPQLDQDRWTDEVNQIVERELNPDKPELFPQLAQKRSIDEENQIVEKELNPDKSELFLQLDQKRWSDRVKKMVKNELNPQQKDVRVCILHVPKRLIGFKPKSYTPQLLGLGPYHHLKPDLQELERFKLAVIAKYLGNHSSPSLKFEGIVRELARYEPTICSCYHKYLDLDGDTLATIIAVDGLFLLEFVEGVAGGGSRIDERSGFVFAARKVTEADVIGDVMMLQNQFPLDLLKLLCLIASPEEEEGNGKFEKVFGIWSSFCELVSPFDTTGPPGELDPGELDGFFDHSMHFLDALYQQILRNGVVSDHHRGKREASSHDGRDNYQQPECPTIEQWTGLLDLMGKVLEEAAKFVGKIPILIKSAIEIVTRTCRRGEKKPDEENPVVEITIPSVTQLIHDANVEFMPTRGGIGDIRFDEKGLVLHLPVLKVNANTEIVLRNLVAFEAASQYSDAPILEEYTELMCGIVDSPEDVALLKSRKIIRSELSNDEVALIFNSMSKNCDKPRTESNIEKAIVGVNKYYNGISKVKTRNRMMQWAFASWKGLTLFCTILLLALTFVESFCQVYGCSSHFFKT